MISMDIKDDDSMAMSSVGMDYCPTIYLNCEQCEALGITGMPAPGTVYMLRVKAVVKRVTAEAEEAGEVATEGSAPDVSLTLSLTDMEITQGGGKEVSSLLYGS